MPYTISHQYPYVDREKKKEINARYDPPTLQDICFRDYSEICDVHQEVNGCHSQHSNRSRSLDRLYWVFDL
jgi:hypothetical protein